MRDGAANPDSLLWGASPELLRALKGKALVVTPSELSEIARSSRDVQRAWVEERLEDERVLRDLKRRANIIRNYATALHKKLVNEIHHPQPAYENLLDDACRTIGLLLVELEEQRPVLVKDGRVLTKRDCSAPFPTED